MTTLRTADEVYDSKTYFDHLSDAAPDEEMLDLAKQLIRQKMGHFEPSEFRDRYQDALRDLITAKVQGAEPAAVAEPERGRVIDLMEALKRSLKTGAEKKPPAKSQARKPAAQRARRRSAAR